MSHCVTVAWSSAQRGRDIIKWAQRNCPSYDRVFGKIIDPSAPFCLQNTYMELWFNDEHDATWCKLRWA